MRTHLDTGDTIPPEYLELVMCRDVYHCTPDNLPAMSKMLAHLTCMEEESKPRRLAKRG